MLAKTILAVIAFLLNSAFVFGEDAIPKNTLVQLQSLLGKEKSHPDVVAFVQQHRMSEYTKGVSGGFSAEEDGISFLYDNNLICRVLLNVHNPPDYPPLANRPLYVGPLPSNVERNDTPDDVIRKLGSPTHRPEPTHLVYNNANPEISFSFFRNTTVLSEIALDSPRPRR